MAATLLPSDVTTATWKRVRASILERISDNSRMLEGIDLDERQTAVIRGRLAELRDLLALEDAPAARPRPGFDPAVVQVPASAGFDS